MEPARRSNEEYSVRNNVNVRIFCGVHDPRRLLSGAPNVRLDNRLVTRILSDAFVFIRKNLPRGNHWIRSEVFSFVMPVPFTLSLCELEAAYIFYGRENGYT